MTGRGRGDSLERIVSDLNPMLRGWFGYFQHATPALFGVLDGFVRRRLRALLRKQEKHPGMGRCTADHQRWPNAFFATHGYSPSAPPMSKRDTPDEETNDWRAVCGRTARTVRRAGRA
jgi:Group II intron, maturase-specific domain